MEKKYDIKVAMKELYAPGANAFVIVEVPPLRYLAIDGAGNPNTAGAYARAVEALYSVSYTLKFASKQQLGRDFTVAPLEGLWRAGDPAAFVTREKDAWRWTMLIAQPEWIGDEMVEHAKAEVTRKKGFPAVPELRPLTLHEGLSVQILHIGPYDDEGPTLARLHDEFMPANGLAFNGDHHEIYLGDPRKSAPERLKTILRQPVKRIA